MTLNLHEFVRASLSRHSVFPIDLIHIAPWDSIILRCTQPGA